MNNQEPHPDPLTTPDAGRGGRRSRWLRRGLIVLAVAAAGYVATVFALSRFLDPVRLADWIEPRLEARLNREVAIGDAEVRLFPLGLRLREVVVYDPTGLAPSLARVGSVELRVAILPLLRRHVQVDRIRLDEPEADLRVGPDGQSNFGDLSPESREVPSPESEERPFGLDLRSVRASGGTLTYTSQVDSLSLTVVGIEGSAAVRRDSLGVWTLAGVSGGALSLERGARRGLLADVPLESSFDMVAGPEFQALDIRNATVRLDRVSLGLRGTIDRLKDPVRQVSIEAGADGLPVEQLLSLLPDSIRQRVPREVRGSLALELHAQGELGPEVRPEVKGRVTLVDIRVSGVQGGVLAEGVSGEVVLEPAGSLRPRLQGTVLGGPASVEGTATLGSGGAIDLRVQGTADLGRAASLVRLPEGVSTAGHLEVDVRVTGPIADLGGLRFAGEVRGTDVRVTHSRLGVPVAIPAGRVRLEGTRATFTDLPVMLGDEGLTGTGEVRDLLAVLEPGRTPYLRASFRGPRLSLERLRAAPAPDTALTYGRVAFARVAGRPVGGRSAEDAARELRLARPDSLPLAGEVEVALDTLFDRRGATEAVRARIEFGPDFLRVTDATFLRYGGVLRTRFGLALGADREEPFSLTFQASEVDASALLGATTSLGHLVHGWISVEVELTGSLDNLLLPSRRSLLGTGRFALRDGGLRSTPVTRELATFLGYPELSDPDIRDWSTSIVLQDGGVLLADAVLSAPGNPRVGGAVGLDGALDLLTVFNLPVERLPRSALDNLGVGTDVAARLLERDDLLQAVLRIGGSVFAPTLEADPAAAARTLSEAVQEEAEEEVKRRIEEQRGVIQERASGFLRGLLQRGEAGRRPGPDTVPLEPVRPDTARTDSVPPDSVRPDTVPPDTVRRDMVRPDVLH